MSQVPTGAYVSLLEPGKTDYTACHSRKTTTYILHVVPITTRTHDRRKSVGKKKTRKRKEGKGMEKKDKKVKKRKRKGNKRKEKTRKPRKDKTRGSKERKIEKNVMLADPRN